MGGLLLLVAFFGALVFLAIRIDLSNERPVEAEVLALGTYAYDTGDMPILTVRLPDGSIRQVLGSWAGVRQCEQRRWISLLQQGGRLRVGLRGCYRRR
jgi:hypothetical protein